MPRQQVNHSQLPGILTGRFQKRVGAANFISVLIGFAFTYVIYAKGYQKELYVLSIGLLLLGAIMIAAALLQRNGKTDHGLVVVMSDFLNMPKTMFQFSFVQFFSWFALFAMWIYTTAAVTSHIYGTSDTTSLLFNEGADWVSVSFGVYNGFAAIIAFALPPLAKWSSRKLVHAFSLLAGGISLAGIYFISDPWLVLLPMIGIGLAWASMLGFMLRNFFRGEAIYALIAGGVYMGIAAFMMLFVDDVDEEQARTVLS